MSLRSRHDRIKDDGPCVWCVRAVKWIPVLFIVGIVLWSYYAYVIQLCIFSITTIWERALFLIFYHFFFVMFLWSYWQTVFTDIGTVPPKFRIPFSEIEKLVRADSEDHQKRILEMFAKDLPIVNRTIGGAIRFCEKCKHIKPDRAHHCSVCGMCVLKMDHHCPWVNTCINFTNYKFFVLFLGYALLYCVFIVLTSIRYFVMFWEGNLNGGMGKLHILFLFFVAIMFAISLVSLFGYHIYLTLVNRSTLEAFRAPIFRVGGPDKNGFSLGKYNNFQEVFGDNHRLWFVPVFTSLGDGMQFPVSIHHQISNYESMGDTSQSMGDGITYPTLIIEEAESLLGAESDRETARFTHLETIDSFGPETGDLLSVTTN